VSKNGTRKEEIKVTKEQILDAGLDGNLYTLIDNFFSGPGIEDWAAARALWHLRFRRQFYWTAAQAIEKLCKACLLSNWESVKPFGHDIVKLCDRVALVSENVLDLNQVIEIDESIREHFVGDYFETRIEFIKRLQTNGSPNSRYGNATIQQRPYDIFAMDGLAFQLIRLNCDLSLADELGETNLEKLRMHPSLSGKIQLSIDSIVYEASAKDFFLNENIFVNGSAKKFRTPRFLGEIIDSAEIALSKERRYFKGHLVTQYIKQNAKINFPK
jgi:hypothetical protein